METQVPALPPGPCNDGATLVMVARCVEGVWELGWMPAEEISNGPTTAGVVGQAIGKGWKAGDVCKLAESLKGKPCL